MEKMDLCLLLRNERQVLSVLREVRPVPEVPLVLPEVSPVLQEVHPWRRLL